MPSHTPQSQPRPATRLWVLVVGLLGVAAAASWYLFSREEPSAAPSTTATEEHQSLGAGRAEQRLRELRAAHESGGVGSGRAPNSGVVAGGPEGGRFQVPGSSGSGTGTKLKPKFGASAATGDLGEGAEGTGIEEPDPDDIPGLKRMALNDPDPDRRLAAVTLLGASDDPQAIPILAEVLKDQDEEVRLAAIQSLADMTGDVPVEVLGNAALSDPSPDNRYEALEALADIAGPAARPYLERALHDPDEDVASLAESLLELNIDEEEGASPPPAESQMR
ncbi:MAG: HEAT repeat domain-containing protein [Candidatus Binatia bacterium]|nr:HEAT repeat domain-containing protein [Candidatus Binatia bacterium]